VPNTLLTIQMRTKEALRILENQLTFTKYITRIYDDQFARKDAKIGNSLDIRKPPRFIGRTGQGLSLEDVTETFVPLTLDTQFGVDVVFSSQELLLDINAFSQKFLKSRVATIANKVDRDGLLLYREVYNAIGTPGTVPATRLLYLQAGQRLDEEAAPNDDDRSVVVSPAMQATIVNTDAALFSPAKSISDQYLYGKKGHALGFRFSMDQNVATHTSGTFTAGSTPLTNGASQTGNSLITDGWANSTAIFSRGDIFTIGINAVNPQSRDNTNALRQFVVTDDVTSDGSGNATLPIEPAMTVSGPFQTVASLAADGVAITPLGAQLTNSPQGLAFHPEAFAMAMVDLPLYRGTHAASRVSDSQMGLSIRTIEDYDINQDRAPCRLDVLYGHVTLYPELAVRMVS
jgi:hypothetical protein